MEVKNFEDFESLERSTLLTKRFITCSRDTQVSQGLSRLRDQIATGAAVSVMSNIAEGFERGGNQEFIQFLYVAKGFVWRGAISTLCGLDQAYVDAERLWTTC